MSVIRPALEPPQTRIHQDYSKENETITTAEVEGKRIEDKKTSKRVVYVNLRDPAEDRRL